MIIGLNNMTVFSGCAQQPQPRFTCNALHNMTQVGPSFNQGFNPIALENCITDISDRSLCRSFTCHGRSSAISLVNGIIMPCEGEDNMSPGMLLIIEDSNSNLLLNDALVLETTSFPMRAPNSFVNVTVEKLFGGMTFQVSFQTLIELVGMAALTIIVHGQGQATSGPS